MAERPAISNVRLFSWIGLVLGIGLMAVGVDWLIFGLCGSFGPIASVCSSPDPFLPVIAGALVTFISLAGLMYSYLKQDVAKEGGAN